MRRVLVANVTAMAMLWHTLAGCCAHHAHGGTSSSTGVQPQVNAVAAIGPGVCCHKPCDSLAVATAHAGRPDDTPASSACPSDSSQPCDEAACVFTASNSLPGVFFKIPPSLDCIACSALQDQQAPLVGQARQWTGSEPAIPPLGGLRRHLALGVLIV